VFRPQDREKCERLLEKNYAGRLFHDSLYRHAIRQYLRSGQRLLDAGCGRYLKFSRELSGIAHVVGIDLDSVLETSNKANPFAVRGDLGRLPFQSESFDMVITRHVVEHLEDPLQVFREFHRVLRPGGTLVVLTPNKYDYVSLFAAMTPHWVHAKLVSRIFRVPEHDVFPTLYRANTLSRLPKSLGSAGLVIREIRTLSHYPAYLMFSPVLFRVGMWYERLTSLEMFRALRGTLLCISEKPAASPVGMRSAAVRVGDGVNGAKAGVA
jgi:SAM-dependent methyltransferase